MRSILDENVGDFNEEERKKIILRSEIRKIEEKNWYGIVLICIVIGLILILTSMHMAIFGLSIPNLVISFLIICSHIILLVLSKTDKLMAYSGGLTAFIVYIILYTIMLKIIPLKLIFWSLIIITSYLIFIYEEFKLKGLKSKIKD